MPRSLRTREVGARYVAASIGAHFAFLPLLTYIIPVRVEALTDKPVYYLSLLLIAGAITASVANIVAGRISDGLMARRGNRQRMALAGLVATAATIVSFRYARSLSELLTVLIAFQIAFNIMYAPLVAVLADHVPNRRKGVTAALLNFALPAGTLATAAAAALAPKLGDWLLPALAATVAAFVLPFLLSWPAPLRVPQAGNDAPAETIGHPPLRRDFLFAWIARLCVQFGAAIVLSYLYLYLGEFGEGSAAARRKLAALTFWATPFALGSCLILARWSDIAGKRRAILAATSLALAGALLLLVIAKAWALAVVAYTIFLASLTIFLALDSALVAELLRLPQKRGWALGWMNLTNTLPSIAAPGLTIALAITSPNPNAIRLSLIVAAVLAVVSAICVWRIRSVR